MSIKNNNTVRINSYQIIDIFYQVGNYGDIITYTIAEKSYLNKYCITILFANVEFNSIRYLDPCLATAVANAWQEYLMVKFPNSPQMELPLGDSKDIEQPLNKIDIVSIFKGLGKLGYGVMYKMDGPRDCNKYTVLIELKEFRQYPLFWDTATLEEGILKVLSYLDSKTITALGIPGLDKLIEEKKSEYCS